MSKELKRFMELVELHEYLKISNLGAAIDVSRWAAGAWLRLSKNEKEATASIILMGQPISVLASYL